MRVTLILLSLLLGACQAPNPYQASSAPIEPAPALSYPAPTPIAVDKAGAKPFNLAQSWAWYGPVHSVPGVSGAQLEDIISQGLDQYGLRPATANRVPDVLVRARLDQRERVRRVYEDPYPGFSPYYHRPYPYAYYPAPRVRVYRERIWQLSIEMLNESGDVLWRGTSQTLIPPDYSSHVLYRAARRALASYPPY